MIPRSDRHRWFSRRLLEAMGLGSLTGLALAGAACGGNVVVDSGKGGSGPGAGGSINSSINAGGFIGVVGVGGTTNVGVGPGPAVGVTTGAGGSPSCSVQVNPPLKQVQACLTASSGCPDSGSPEAQTLLAKTLGLCNPQSGNCCTQPTLDEVVCGPFFTPAGACCYIGLEDPSQQCGTGRPFTAAGEARTAPTRARTDWAGAACAAPSATALDPVTRRALAKAWERDARYEHASVASFARLALELLAVGAPPELVRDAQKAMGDEIRHAEMCFALAGAYAGAPVGPGPLSLDGALGRTSLAEVAAAAVREGCVGETLAALAAAEAGDLADDPAVRAALSAIAADEAEHAAMAWRLVAWAHREGGAEVREAIAAAFAEPFDLGAQPAPEGVDAAAYRAHGRLLPAEQRALAARALAEVVRPSAAALLGSAPVEEMVA